MEVTKAQIQMVDLRGQYDKIKDEIDEAIQSCLDSARFIKGPIHASFEKDLASYLEVEELISCGNGTDALQIALMALNLKAGDEVVVPSFTYAATAEVVALLGLSPVMIDVDPAGFNIRPQDFAEAITSKTKAVVPVHLFGQNAPMKEIIEIAKDNSIYVIEDSAQSIGSVYTFPDGRQKKSGAMGDIGCTSFFPSKNLGCFGDGGAIYTQDPELGASIRKIASHGQSKKYFHEIIGVNSRLDALQAAILQVKLRYLDDYCSARQAVAASYDEALAGIDGLDIPVRMQYSTHVFHQYTVKVAEGRRDGLKSYLQENGIPSMIYYPLPLYKQGAYKEFYHGKELESTEALCSSVLSLPIHTEMDLGSIKHITDSIRSFFN